MMMVDTISTMFISSCPNFSFARTGRKYTDRATLLFFIRCPHVLLRLICRLSHFSLSASGPSPLPAQCPRCSMQPPSLGLALLVACECPVPSYSPVTSIKPALSRTLEKVPVNGRLSFALETPAPDSKKLSFSRLFFKSVFVFNRFRYLPHEEPCFLLPPPP